MSKPNKSIQVRASRCPIAVNCAGFSAMLNIIPKHIGSTEVANAGTIVHEKIAQFISTGETDTTFPDKNTAILYYKTEALWESDVKPYLDGAEIYVEAHMKDEYGSGTSDIVGVFPDRLLVFDWKTGPIRRDNRAQFMRYADLALQTFYKDKEPPKEIYLGCGYVADDESDWEVVTPEDIATFKETLLGKIEEGTTGDPSDMSLYAEGQHCEYCPAITRCPAKRSGLLGLVEEKEFEVISPDEILYNHALVKAARKQIDRIDNAIKQIVASAGAIPLPDGERELGFSERKKRTIIPSKAAIIAQRLSREQMDEVVSISLTKAVDFVRANAEQGQKTAAAKEFEAELDEAGAIERTTYKVLSVQKIKKDQPKLEKKKDDQST